MNCGSSMDARFERGFHFSSSACAPEQVPLIEQLRTDAIPEHIRSVARLVGGDLYLTEFDARSRSVQDLLVHPGPLRINGEDQLAWTQSDVFVRLIRMTQRHRGTWKSVHRKADALGDGLPA